MAELNQTLLHDALAYTEKWLDYQFGGSQLVGMAVAVQHENKILFSKAYGLSNIEQQTPLTTGHYFRFASHSKMFTATAVMLLAEQGKLQLDDPVSRHLPWFRSAKDAGVESVTIRQLLSHSSGLIRDGEDSNYWALDAEFPTQEQLRAYIKDARLILRPNERFKYSNFGYSYLGIMIEAITGQTYGQHVHSAIIDPLKLSHTAMDLDAPAEQHLATGYSVDRLKTGRRPYRQVRTNGMAAATGLYSTIEDMCRFAAAYYLGNEQLLADNSKREMQRLQWKIAHSEQDYGLGLDLSKAGERALIGHGGGFTGFITATKIDPEANISVVVATNSLDGPAERVTYTVFDIINYFLEADSQPNGGAKRDLGKFEGRFFSEWGVADIVKVGNSLVSVYPGQWTNPFKEVAKLSYQAPERLRIDDMSGYGDPGESIRYTFNKDGTATEIVFAGLTHRTWGNYKKLRKI